MGDLVDNVIKSVAKKAAAATKKVWKGAIAAIRKVKRSEGDEVNKHISSYVEGAMDLLLLAEGKSLPKGRENHNKDPHTTKRLLVSYYTYLTPF